MAILEAGRLVAAGTPESLSERLDLQPLMGGAQAGALLDARVASHDDVFQLSTLSFEGGVLRVPKVNGPVGSRFRVQIHARDVALATERPHGLSIQNILEGQVSQIDETHGPYAEVKLTVGKSALVARLTRESVHRLGIVQGRAVFVLVKSVAIDADAWSASPE
jgi:molybdate transport system ATP-binding protein